MGQPWGNTSTGGDLPHVQQYVVANGVQVGADVVAIFEAQQYEYGITDLNINGPVCRVFELWANAIGAQPILDSTSRTDVNTATYPTPKRIAPNMRVFAVWRNATGTATASINTVSY